MLKFARSQKDTGGDRGAPLSTLLLGGCMVHWPILRTPYGEGRLNCNVFGRLSEVHTFGEMFQIIDVLQGRKDVPTEIRPFAHMRPALAHAERAENFDGLDLALLGPSSPVELTFRGFAVNRTALRRQIMAVIEDDTDYADKLFTRWSRIGLIGLNEKVRRETAAELAKYLQQDTADSALARDVVLETRAHQGDLAAGFRRMREILQCPIGVVLYVFRYMPDGRAISWPAGFREDVLAAAAELKFPLFDPAPLVVKYGIDAALLAFHAHYSEEFLPVIGKATVEFAERVHREGMRLTAR